MRIQCVRGPLGAEQLAAVASLYGAYNAKYADVEFCQRLFEEGPAGHALHALAIEGRGSIVGHYAIVPMDLTTPNAGRIRSGKGEAFVVHTDHRRTFVDGPGSLTPGLALPRALYAFAHSEGIGLVHLMAAPAVGAVHRLAGCRELRIPGRRSGLVLAPDEAGGEARTSAERLLHVALAHAQGIAERAAEAATLAWVGAARSAAVATLPTEARERLAADFAVDSGWTIALDAAILLWLGRVGELEWVGMDDSPGDYAVICPRAAQGRSAEIVLWHQQGRTVGAARRLLRAVVHRARQRGAANVAFSHVVAVDAGENERLRLAARSLCFRERDLTLGFYVHVDGTDPGALRFHPLFHAVY